MVVKRRLPVELPEEILERQRLREENLHILRETLIDKEILIKSNIYFDRKQRKYIVKEVKDEYLSSGGRLIHGFRLANHDYPQDQQPFLKYPTQLIVKEKDRLKLIYASDVNIERDFRQLHRSTRPDLEVYIYY